VKLAAEKTLIVHI